ncbi:MAG: lipocalin family protein [Allomuricauda sp.]
MNLLGFRPIIRNCTVLIILLVIGIASCSKDDAPTENEIIGTWQLSSATRDGVNLTIPTCAKLDKIEIKSNKTFVQTGYYSPSENDMDCTINEEASSSGTWSIPSKGKLKFTYLFEGVSISETWYYSISENKLTSSSEEITLVYVRK